LLSSNAPAFQQFYHAFAPAVRKTLGVQPELIEGTPAVLTQASTLVIAAGTASCLQLLKQESSRPVLCTLTPRLAIMDALAAYPGPATALFLDQPLERQLRLIKHALPDARTLGFVAGPVSKRQLPELTQATTTHGWKLASVNHTADDNIVATLRPLLGKTDVLLAVPDPEVYRKENIYYLLLALYRKNIPLFGFSSAYVDAGALAAVFSTPEQIAQQTVELAARWLKDPQHAAPTPEYPRYFTVRVNRGVANSLQLAVPDEQRLQRHLKANESTTEVPP
jgi:ABC-type uncharacterized transport system substrate-binding protein